MADSKKDKRSTLQLIGARTGNLRANKGKVRFEVYASLEGEEEAGVDMNRLSKILGRLADITIVPYKPTADDPSKNITEDQESLDV